MEEITKTLNVIYSNINVCWTGYNVSQNKNGLIVVFCAFSNGTSEQVERIKYTKYQISNQRKDLFNLIEKYRPHDLTLPIKFGQLEESLSFLQELQKIESEK